MRILKNFTVLFFLTAFIISCVDENESNADFVGTISEPTNISALVSITQDNTGLVTITPTGEGVVTFHVDYGCLLYTSPSPRDRTRSRMPSSA